MVRTDQKYPGLHSWGHSSQSPFPLEVNVARNKDEAINSYITDMLSLEEHIQKAVNGQLEDLADYPEVTRDLRQVLRKVEQHISDLQELSTRRSAKGPGDAIKRAGSILLGLGAAAVDLVRKEGLAKNLRDDYTAFSLATVGYVMLHTTALSLGEQEVADLARQHFADYAQAVTLLHNVIPGAVVRFLREDGLPVRDDVLPQISRTIEEVWHSQSAQAPRAEETSVARNA
jgi:ferritin-like metal-binding protein YciE